MRGHFARSGLYTSGLREAMRTLFVIAPAVLFLYAFRRFAWTVVP
uniref:Uncharacterized protein n=1 Tax=Siphoviridae sp. ctkyp1 TaxID=2825646 RepID=A0A8S5P5H0_9CAUD|nr:MAG TPA: hypothetical protein [Siphoviridae sp. ctkyp1]